jgi:hypothetical protein
LGVASPPDPSIRSLAPVRDRANRSTDMPGHEGDQEVLEIELAVGAEATADIVFDQIDSGQSQSEHRG